MHRGLSDYLLHSCKRKSEGKSMSLSHALPRPRFRPHHPHPLHRSLGMVAC